MEGTQVPLYGPPLRNAHAALYAQEAARRTTDTYSPERVEEVFS
jgi:hypothetical protein